MNSDIAGKLLNGLENHPEIIHPAGELFLDILTSKDLFDSGSFSEKLLETKQTLNETGQYFYLSLRRVLQNKLVKYAPVSTFAKLYETFISPFARYSSDSLVRSLQTDKTLVNLMKTCKEKYSLLVKFETNDYCDDNEELKSIIRPILIIPGVSEEGMKCILDWENKHTGYFKEKTFLIFGSYKVKVSEKFYLNS